jgi:hypothetical protein
VSKQGERWMTKAHAMIAYRGASATKTAAAL